MTIRHLALATALSAALAAGVLPLLAQADEEPAAPANAASATSLLKTPEQKREAATAPDLRPEQAAVPQIRIPLGRSAPAQRPAMGQAGRGASAASAGGSIGGINDGAARCEAKASAAERAACRQQLAHETKPR